MTVHMYSASVASAMLSTIWQFRNKSTRFVLVNIACAGSFYLLHLGVLDEFSGLSYSIIAEGSFNAYVRFIHIVRDSFQNHVNGRLGWALMTYFNRQCLFSFRQTY